MFEPLWVYALPLCTCIVLWFSDKVVRLPVSAESECLCSVSASCSPLDVVSDMIQGLDSNVAPSFTQHASLRCSRMRISSCEIEMRPSVFTLLSDRNPLSHELTPVHMMEHWPWLRALYKAPPPHTHTRTTQFPSSAPPSVLLFSSLRVIAWSPFICSVLKHGRKHWYLMAALSSKQPPSIQGLASAKRE